MTEPIDAETFDDVRDRLVRQIADAVLAENGSDYSYLESLTEQPEAAAWALGMAEASMKTIETQIFRSLFNFMRPIWRKDFDKLRADAVKLAEAQPEALKVLNGAKKSK